MTYRFIKLALAAISISLLSLSAQAIVVVDFEDDGNGNTLNPGDVITGATINGATFSVFNQGNAGNRNNGANPDAGIPDAGIDLPADFPSGLNSGNRELMLFNASCGDFGPPCTGNDPDLAIDGAGNVLIISEDNNSNDPDDSRFGGAILVDFAPPVVELDSLVVDVGDNNGQGAGDSFAAAYYQGTFVARFDFLDGLGNNNLQTAEFGGQLIDLLIISLDSSGGVVSLEFTPVPVPAAAWLFAAALGSLQLARRNKRSS